jgi:uncharacterized membrane protein
VKASLKAGSFDYSQRFASIDAARGAAMLFVCLSHFTGAYLLRTAPTEFADYLSAVSMVASPTFVIVSGMVVGFLAATNPNGFAELRVKLVDRGIFLLLFGHLFLTLTGAPAAARFAHAYRTSFITDAIGVSIIFGPSLVTTLLPKLRIAFAAMIFLADWQLIAFWHPVGVALVAKTYLIGLTGDAGQISAIAVFPVIPWLAVYMAASVLGGSIGNLYLHDERKAAHEMIARIGASSVIIAGLFYAGVMTFLDSDRSFPHSSSAFLTLVSIYGKFPPGVVYLGFFGGAGLLLLAVVFEIDRKGKMPVVMQTLRAMGRASLMIFTVQYAVYRTLLPSLHLPYTPLWPLLFGLSIILLAWLATIWGNHDGNRFLTVGITAWWKHDAARQPTGRLVVVVPAR